MTNIPKLDAVKSYFEKCIVQFGDSPRGSDWNSDAAQQIRYDQLLKLCDTSAPFSILDYGCGYGALGDYLTKKGIQADYYGYDIVEKVIETAQTHHKGKPQRTFFTNEADLPVCDYVVAAGIFNYRADESFDSWTEYVINTFNQFNTLSRKGFASNFLTKYSDADRMREDLYYPDPCYYFDYCKRNYSKNVALLHDYQLYDFTILIRKG
jgi:SAM-dependent methyltransferase